MAWRKRGNFCPIGVRGGVSPREWEYHFGYEKTEKHQRAISKTSSASNTGPDDYVTDAHGICMHQAHMNRLKIMNTKDYETRTPLH